MGAQKIIGILGGKKFSHSVLGTDYNVKWVVGPIIIIPVFTLKFINYFLFLCESNSHGKR